MSLGMSYFQTRSKTKWWGHHAVAKSSVAVGRVTGIALSVPGLWVSLGLCFPLVVTEAVREAAVRVGGVASVTTHSLIHSPAHGGGGGPALLSVGHVTFLKWSSFIQCFNENTKEAPVNFWGLAIVFF